jgi:hypothetical protein
MSIEGRVGVLLRKIAANAVHLSATAEPAAGSATPASAEYAATLAATESTAGTAAKAAHPPAAAHPTSPTTKSSFAWGGHIAHAPSHQE